MNTDNTTRETLGRRHPHRLHHRTTSAHPLDHVPHLNAVVAPINQAELRARIAVKERHQALRRAHLAELQALIDRHDREIRNLTTQLDRQDGGCGL